MTGAPRRTFARFLPFGAALALGCAASGPPPKAYDQAVGNIHSEIVQALASRGETRLAVLPLEAEGDVARSVGGLMIDELAASLAKTPQVTFVERNKMKAIIKEMALQQTGLIQEENQIQMGKLAGAQVLLAVRATLIGESINMTVRLMDVETGTALTGVSLRVAYDDALKKAIADRDARMNIRTSKEVLAALGQVRAGELREAEEFFEPLSKEQAERRSVGLMGLAAVAYARDQTGPASEMCQVSRQASSAPTYCWVVEGNIAYGQGDLDKALDLLSRALDDNGTLLDWMKSNAANGLGLIMMGKEKPDVALGMYDKAIALDPTNAEALSNKARILEKNGDLATAIQLYQRGMKANPDDKVLSLLLRDAEMRLAFAADEARQKTVAALASEIVANKDSKSKPKGDGWTSSAVTVTMLPIEEKGAPPARLGETSFLEASLRSGLEELKGVEIVDRQLLGKVLEELQLSTSNLGDESTALKVGRIMSARAMLGGTIVRMEGESQLTMKIIETETTRIVGSVNEIYESGTRLSKVARELKQLLQEKVKKAFPLRAKVVAKKGKRLQINVGTTLGAAEGDTFTLYDPKKKKALGKAKVVEVDADSAWLELTEGKRAPKGARAERTAGGSV